MKTKEYKTCSKCSYDVTDDNGDIMEHECVEQEEVVDNYCLLALDHVELYNSDLRADLNSRKIKGNVLRTQGYVGNRPRDFKGDFHEDDTWAIDCLDEDGIPVTSYLYVSEYEYNQDVEKIFKD